MSTNINTFVGTYTREGTRIFHDCFLIKVVTRSNPKPRQPLKYLVCYPDTCTDTKLNFYLSGLYPTEQEDTYRIEYNKVYYHVYFSPESVTITTINR